MASTDVKNTVSHMEMDRGGAFDFSNCIRNQAMCKMGAKAPRLTSTGTTIVAVSYKVLGNWKTAKFMEFLGGTCDGSRFASYRR